MYGCWENSSKIISKYACIKVNIFNGAEVVKIKFLITSEIQNKKEVRISLILYTLKFNNFKFHHH